MPSVMQTGFDEIAAPLLASNGNYTSPATDIGLPGVRVLVRDVDAQPLPGAVVTLLDARGRQIERGESDGAGACEFVAFGRGQFLLVLWLEGYQPQSYCLPWPEGTTTRELEVTLTGAARLTGSVTSPRGRPLVDVLVTLTDTEGVAVASARTDAAGSYEFGDLTLSMGVLSVFADAWPPLAVPVQIGAGARVRADVEVPGAGALIGAARTSQGAPIPDAAVRLMDDQGTELGCARTDTDGGYRFDGLETGDYTVVAAGYAAAVTEIEVGPGHTAVPALELTHARG